MTKEEYIKYAQDNNMKINEQTVDRILKRLDITKGYCPCVSPDKWNNDYICPCKFCKNDVEKNGHCHCNLFLK